MRIRLSWRKFGRGLRAVLVLGLFWLAVPQARPNLLTRDQMALTIVHEVLFDFASWEIEALLGKTANNTVAAQHYMTEDDRTAFVREYLQLVNDIASLEAQITNIYTDPAIIDPEAASATLCAERDRLRTQQTEWQTLTEVIMESQIAAVLADEGFGTGGQIFPPVQIHFTQLPNLLVISPRDHIERVAAYTLVHGLPVEQQAVLEERVDDALNVSSLVVPLGGLAVYPAMLIESGYAPHVFSISAHEWTHHYLTFFLLGFNYGLTPELYTINETVASIVGDEVGWLTLSRYYPDLAPPPPDLNPQPSPQTPSDAPPTFDFRAEMHATRVHVDELLAAGEIEEAEQYMEEQRQVFVAQGYQIRKLNQAYFAFYGAYADQPGARGEDPIGPAVRELRLLSPSLHDFVTTVRPLTTFDELQAALQGARTQTSHNE